MFAVSLLIVSIIALATGYFAIPYLIRAFRRYQGARVVTCPETHAPVTVEIDARHAALTSIIGRPEIRLDHCSRWPINQDCGQECMVDLEGIAPDCLVKGILTKWYRGKSCAYCAKQFTEIRWSDHKPALQNADGMLLDWSHVPFEHLNQTMATSLPVCWDCYIAQSFKREHPDLVTFRPWVNEQSASEGRR